MPTAGVISLLVALVVFGVILFRQVQTRPVRSRSLFTWILLLVGLVQIGDLINKSGARVRDLLALLLMLVIGAGLALVRAYTVRVWIDGDAAYRRGTAVTVGL